MDLTSKAANSGRRTWHGSRSLRYAGLTISHKVGVIFLLILVVAIANLLVMHATLRNLNGFAETVNVAGRLRMLSQKIAFETVKVQHEHGHGKSAVPLLLRDIEAGLSALRHGGNAFGYDLKAVSQPMFPLLTAVQRDWESYKRQVEAALLNATPSSAASDDFALITESASRFLADAEALVGALTIEIQNTQERALTKMYFLLLVDACVLALVFAAVRRQIVYPLRKLAEHSHALAQGQYSAELKIGTHDEIGQLALAFSHSAKRIGELIGSIEQEKSNLQQAESMFRGLAENSVVGVYIAQNGAFRFVNPKMAHMFAYSCDEMVASVKVFDIVPEDERELVAINIKRRIDGEIDAINYVRKARRKDGMLFDVEVFGSKMEIDGGTATIGVMLDITERTRAEAARMQYAQMLEYHANHDVLTGLANRHRLSACLKQSIASARRSGLMVAVLLLDLDRFKVINDSLGHAAGDEVLQAVASRLRACVRITDTVARLGGDEFVVVLPDLEEVDNVSLVARKILDALALPVSIANQDLYVGASIGISLYPQDGSDEEVLLKNVDMAMYRAKQTGRANYEFFTEEIRADNRERHALEAELHQALSRGELLLHYQPKVSLRTRQIVGVEALVRWAHPERGMIAPSKFIAVAEETGLILPLGNWVLHTACAQGRAWQAAGARPINIAVNLSARQFRHHDLLGLVRQAIRDTGFDPTLLDLEITESVIMQDAQEAVATMLELKKLGVRLSLDDFGTGYSSLNYLSKFPLDNLKIDQLFVEGIGSNSHDTTIVKAVVALAHNLNLNVIAEGVENQFQLDFLHAHECDEIQGYYFSKPVPAEQIPALLAASAFG